MSLMGVLGVFYSLSSVFGSFRCLVTPLKILKYIGHRGTKSTTYKFEYFGFFIIVIILFLFSLFYLCFILVFGFICTFGEWVPETSHSLKRDFISTKNFSFGVARARAGRGVGCGRVCGLLEIVY